MKRRRWLWIGALYVVQLLVPVQAKVQVLVVTGLGGEPIFAERFDGWARNLRDIALARFGTERANFVWLASSGSDDADGDARLANLRDSLTRMSERGQPDDVLLIALIGHGTARGQDVAFNLRGPDLTPTALDAMLAPYGERTVVIANLAAASGPFIPAVSRSGRVIVTATATPREYHVARFGGHFVEAFAVDAADADKDARVSVFEAFQFARQAVARSYKADSLLQTEHALLDDNGDGQGTLDPAREGGDGVFARAVYLVSTSNDADTGPDSAARLDLKLEARRLVAAIESLKRRRAVLHAAEYETELEELLVTLALNRRALRQEGQ